MKYSLLGMFFLFLSVPVGSASAAAIDGGYAVIVSKATREDPAWGKVAEALAAKYGGEIIMYDHGVEESLAPLRKSFPRYACFIARPDEIGREFVIHVHQLTRKLDDDPYTDLLWGIITGYRADDAMRIVCADRPLVIRKAAAGTPIDLDLFDEGVWYDEGKKGAYCEKKPGAKAEKKSCPADTTEALVDVLDNDRPELFLTSGHATDRDWQIGYSYRNGQFRCKDGVLLGVDLTGKAHPIHSTNPKVYLASGNCLMGLVRDKQSMAVAWLGSGGANQMIGYVVETWYGKGGWGTRDWFFDEPGRYSLSDAFYFNNQKILNDLRTRFPKAADKSITDFDHFGVPAELNKEIEAIRSTRGEQDAKDCLGLIWDRDTVAFYGDPAWDARLAPAHFPYETSLSVRDGVFTLRLTAESDCRPRTPPSKLLPYRVEDVKVMEGEAMRPLVTDNFIMVLGAGELKKGKTYDIVFKAKRISK